MAPLSVAAWVSPRLPISSLRPSDATFGFTEVKLGLLPAIIAPFVLAKIGRSAARELFLTGRRFTADEAKQIGLVHAVVPPDQLDAAVAGYVDEILAAGREAIAASKALIRQIATARRRSAAPQRGRHRGAPRFRGSAGADEVVSEKRLTTPD